MKEMSIAEKNNLLVDNIRALCFNRGIKVAQLENELDFSNGSIGKWRTAKKVASRERVQAVADYFGISLLDLITQNGVAYNSAPGISEDNISFPVIGGVAAGYDHIAYEDWTGDSIEIPRSYLKGKQPQDYFVLRVQGDSMYPDFQDGDHVLILRQSTMDRSGQVGVVIYDDESSTLKRIEYVVGEDWMTLRPINPQYPPVTIRDESLEHCKVLGVAKIVIRELNQ